MTLERKIAKLFKLTDENWMKHANPWSVWTRYSVLPIIVLAFWSRVWIGWWSLIPAVSNYSGQSKRRMDVVSLMQFEIHFCVIHLFPSFFYKK